MEESFDTSTSTYRTDTSSKIIQVKAASTPIVPIQPSDPGLKQQVSAPSYFHSLNHNELPPFVKPKREPTPKLLIGAILNEDEVIEMIANADADKDNGLKNYLGRILVEKNLIHKYDLSEKRFLISYISETIDYAAQRDFNPFKLSVLLTIYLATHRYFKWFYWQTPANIWHYFKELMIRHTIEDTPDGQEVFSPEECYDIITHFHTIYMCNLPLIHIVTFGCYRLKYMWPFKK